MFKFYTKSKTVQGLKSYFNAEKLKHRKLFLFVSTRSFT